MLKTHGAFSRLRCAVTVNLTNRPHRDLDDAGKCFAIWVQKYVGGKPPKPPKQWWLLFPSVGLAIQLVHGVRISWNGRCAQHCSISVPGEEGDELLSLFAATSLNVQRHKDAWASYKAARVVQRGKQLKVGALRLYARLGYRVVSMDTHVPQSWSAMFCSVGPSRSQS